MHKNWSIGVAAVTLAIGSFAERPTVAQPVRPPADGDHTLYALGVLISRNLEDFQLSPAEFERVKAGLIDGATNPRAPGPAHP
jgi:hypothetical protein